MPAPSATSLPAAKSPQRISLDRACALALQHHPDLRSQPLELRIADARLLAASRFPNPSIGMEIEDFAGNGEYTGTRSAIYTASIVQTLETGGKRAARGAIAAAGGTGAVADYQVRRREVLVETSQYFIEALAAKEARALAERELTLARDGLTSVTTQLQVGRAQESDQRQAEMVVTQAELALRQAGRNSEQALAALATQWGDRKGRPSEAVGFLSPPPANLPSRAKLSQNLPRHPRITSAEARQRMRESELKLARAQRFSDVELAVGARHDNANDDQSVLIGARVALPFFDNRQAPVSEAEAALALSQLEIEASRNQLSAKFDAVWTELANAHDAAVTVENSLLPGAHEVFGKTLESYELGRASFLQLAEARRLLAADNRRWLEARRDYQLAAAKLQGLTGTSL